MRDITNRADIELLVNSFYDKVSADNMLGHIFKDVAAVDWIIHLPKMYSFWETMLLQKLSFSGNPMFLHIDLRLKTDMGQKQYYRWLTLWCGNVDALFEGDIATKAKQCGNHIARLMEHEIENHVH